MMSSFSPAPAGSKKSIQAVSYKQLDKILKVFLQFWSFHNNKEDGPFPRTIPSPALNEAPRDFTDQSPSHTAAASDMRGAACPSEASNAHASSHNSSGSFTGQSTPGTPSNRATGLERMVESLKQISFPTASAAARPPKPPDCSPVSWSRTAWRPQSVSFPYPHLHSLFCVTA